MEGVIELGLTTIKETEHGAPGVVRSVVRLFSKYPNRFVREDVSDWSLPRIE